MKKYIYLFFIVVYASCTVTNYPNHPKWLCNKKLACIRHTSPIEEIKLDITGMFNNSSNNFLYEDFPNEDLNYGNSNYDENLVDGNHRAGKIRNGFKEGKWLSGNVGFDSENNIKREGEITKEEYFKKGLRDSVFKQYDGNGKIIYETTFKMGTGFWKEFHSNGKLYFEVYTKDGYFIDTLKLYNKKGELAEKRLYKKDSLIFKENMILDYFPTDNK